MRRSNVWLLVAVIWMAIAVSTAVRQGWRYAWLQVVIALAFFLVFVKQRRKESPK